MAARRNARRYFYEGVRTDGGTKLVGFIGIVAAAGLVNGGMCPMGFNVGVAAVRAKHSRG